MFTLSDSNTFYLYPYPTDMRKSFYSLSGIVQNEMRQDIQQGDAFIFVNRSLTSMKILHMEFGGLVIYNMKLEQIASKDKIIADQLQLLASKDKTHKEEMAKLEAQVDYLKRKLWGKMSEKRQLPEDPRQLKINFEGLELTDKEKKELQEAEEYIRKERKTVRVKEHVKQQPVRHKLPDTLRRVETHLYPEGYEGHEDEWVLFGDTETSEQLEVTAPDMWVSVTIRHKAMRKSDKKVMTAACPQVPIPKSIAGVSLLTELVIGKYVDHLPFWRQIAQYKRLGSRRVSQGSPKESDRQGLELSPEKNQAIVRLHPGWQVCHRQQSDRE